MTKKIKILDACLFCSKPLDKKKRQRTYCSTQCRVKYHCKKYYYESGGREAQRARDIAKAKSPSSTKVKCGLCGLWFRKVGSHVRMTHKITAREYREQLNLPLKRGILRNGVRERLKEIAKANKTILDGVKGRRFRFYKNDPRTRINKGYKSKAKLVKKLDIEIYE